MQRTMNNAAHDPFPRKSLDTMHVPSLEETALTSMQINNPGYPKSSYSLSYSRIG